MRASDRVGKKVLDAQKEEAKLEREYKEAVIKLSKVVPTLVDELKTLRRSIDRR